MANRRLVVVFDNQPDDVCTGIVCPIDELCDKNARYPAPSIGRVNTDRVPPRLRGRDQYRACHGDRFLVDGGDHHGAAGIVDPFSDRIGNVVTPLECPRRERDDRRDVIV